MKRVLSLLSLFAVFGLGVVSSVRADLMTTNHYVPVDLFESGALDSQWSVTAGSPVNVVVRPSFDVWSYGGFVYGPVSPTQGTGMMVLDGVDPLTRVAVAFLGYAGEKLSLDMLFATLDTSRYPPSMDDFARILLNGTEAWSIASIDVGTGDGMDNTGWRSLSGLPVISGTNTLVFEVENSGTPSNSSQLMLDRIMVSGNGPDPRLSGNPVPAPETLALLGIGIVSLIGVRSRRRKL